MIEDWAKETYVFAFFFFFNYWMIHRSVLSRSGTSVGIKMSEKELSIQRKKMKVLQKAQRTVAYDQTSSTSDLISRESCEIWILWLYFIEKKKGLCSSTQLESSTEQPAAFFQHFFFFFSKNWFPLSGTFGTGTRNALYIYSGSAAFFY